VFGTDIGTGDRANGAPTGTLGSAVGVGVAGKVVELATLVVLATVVPRLLGPADYGRFALALTVVTIASLALTLGGPPLVTRFVPPAPPEQRVALARALAARLGRSRAVLVAAMATAVTVAVASGATALPPAETAIVLAAVAFNVATTVVLLVPLGLGRPGPWSARYPFQNAILIGSVLVLAPVAGAVGPVLAILVAAATATIAAVVVVGPLLAVASPASVAVPAGALRFGALQASGAALVQLTHRAGVLVVAVLVGSSVQTGYAALATSIGLGASYAVLQVYTVSLPHVAGRPRSGGAAGERVLRRMTAVMTAVLVPSLAAGAAGLDGALPRLFGPGFAAAVPAFVPALALVALAPVAAHATQVASLRLRPRVALESGIGGVVAFALVAAAAVPSWRAAGATAASLAGVASGVAVALARLPGAVTPPLALGAFGGAALVVAVGVAA
jgi:O-antigen/teichoic acid export membrane protein